jgi:hypothetical protein
MDNSSPTQSDGSKERSGQSNSEVEPPNPQGVKWFREYSIPIAGIILIALFACLIAHYTPLPAKLAASKDSWDATKNFFEVLAIIVGGGWAIFRFRIGREFQESLIPIVSGKLIFNDNEYYLVVHIQIKNVGQSKINFLPKASTLKLFQYTKLSSVPTLPLTVPDTRINQFDPLNENDKYIEPNEIIEGIQFIAMPNNPDLGIRLDLEIISAKNDYTWRTSCRVEKFSGNDNIDSVSPLGKGPLK